jgi:hypothetical protein
MLRELIPFAKLPREIEILSGKRPSRATCYRWLVRGINGVRLKSVKIGNMRFVNREALEEFFADAGGKDSRTIPSAPSRMQKKATAERNQVLSEASALGIVGAASKAPRRKGGDR